MNAFSFDFSKDKPDVRELIPVGTVVLVRMTYTPGGAGPNGALTKGKEPGSDVEYLKSEYTVQRGPYKGRKFWGNMTATGGKVNEQGNSIATGITRQTIRMMIDSSLGLSSKDDSPAAAAKRILPNGFASLQGITFVAKTKIEKGQNGYPDRNGLGQVLTIDMKDYPKSEAELDAPPKAPGSQVPALPAPAWGAPPNAPPAAPTQTVLDVPPAVIIPAHGTVGARSTGNGALPAWARA